MLQIRLSAEFLVKYNTQKTRSKARMDGRNWQSKCAGIVVLCLYLVVIHENILIWSKQCPVLLCPL
jgi:lipid-A-disaccharide synthase-like uncharacterized protein